MDAAKAAAGMRNNRVGVLGNYYCGMLDVYSDLTQQSAAFGNHFELLEMCELNALRKEVTGPQAQAKIRQFSNEFVVAPECQEAEIERAARTSCAMDALIAKHDLGSLAYYYESIQGSEYQDIVTSVIAGNTLLTGHGIPVAGECEIKNVQAMKIMDLLGAGGSFSELYLADFKDDVVYLGHDGPAHFAIAEGRVKLVPLPIYHGKPGKGLSIQMTVRHGPVTLLSVVQRGDGTLMLWPRKVNPSRAPSSRLAIPTVATGFQLAREGSSTTGQKRAPRIIARLALDTSPAKSRSSEPFLAWICSRFASTTLTTPTGSFMRSTSKHRSGAIAIAVFMTAGAAFAQNQGPQAGFSVGQSPFGVQNDSDTTSGCESAFASWFIDS